MPPNQIQLSAFTGLLGVLFAFGFTYCKDAKDRKKRLRGNLAALKAEMEYCGKTACIFLSANPVVKSPSYRLPTLCYQSAFPSLLSEHILSEEEFSPLIEYFAGVETLNRGLDQANEAIGNGTRLDEEHDRNTIKARRLIPSSEQYTVVKSLLERLSKSNA